MRLTLNGSDRSYDGNGNLLTKVDARGVVTQFTYDALDHLTQSSMTRNGTTQNRTFTYDQVTQRLTSVTTPEAGGVSYLFNTDGTVGLRTDA